MNNEFRLQLQDFICLKYDCQMHQFCFWEFGSGNINEASVMVINWSSDAERILIS